MIAQLVETARQRRIHLTDVRATVISRLNKVDRALNRLDEAYRSLVSIYDELDLLRIPFGPGKGAVRVAGGLKRELDRVRSAIFSAEKELEDGLSALAETLSGTDVDTAANLANALDDLFRVALSSKRFLEFFIELGMLLEFATHFADEIARRYDFRLTSNRDPLVRETVQRLRNRTIELG